MHCLYCQIPLYSIHSKKFCSRSCAAKTNNKIRIHSEETKQKIFNSLKKNAELIGKPFSKRKPKHLRRINPPVLRYIDKICPTCKSSFKTKEDSIANPSKVFCSKSCIRLGGKRKGSGIGIKGWYDNIYFDSSWELSYYIYCKDHNIEIKRCKEYFLYEAEDNVERKFYPDFIVNSEIIEIKGWMRIRDKCKMEATKGKVKFLTYNELNHVFDYLREKYSVIINNGRNDMVKFYNGALEEI